MSQGVVCVVKAGGSYLGSLFEKNSIILDADPNVMAMARKIFSHGQTRLAAGKHTHKILILPLNNANSKDILWIGSRYELTYLDRDELDTRSAQYDEITKSVENADKDPVLRLNGDCLKMAIQLQDHQVKFRNMANKVQRMLLADMLGLGKTFAALSTIAEKEYRPAIVVCPPHLCLQWEREAKRMYPDITTHVISGFKTYTLPKVDLIVTSYNRLAPWEDHLYKEGFATVIFDEVHDVRKTTTQKREYAKLLSQKATRCFGLSGTPIYNYGIELWSVVDCIAPDSLGTEYEFSAEWCVEGKVREPAVLNNYLKKRGLMLRRTPEDIGMKFGEATKHVYAMDTDMKTLEAAQDVMKMLALTVLSGNINESAEAEREFSYKLRMMTGLAKARPVAQFVKMIVEQGEKVVLAGWHRDVYDIWLKELAEYNPLMITGSESPKEKQRNVQAFIDREDCKILMLSLRSGAGIDGLQYVCRNVVFGELDWSPHVMDQVVGRIDRQGQRFHPQAYYLTINDGSDPFIMNILANKRSQHDGIVEGKQSEAEIVEGRSHDPILIKEMAKNYLAKIGEVIPEAIQETGVLADVASILRQIRVPTNSEEEMQEALHPLLSQLQYKVTREYRIGKRSRVDFMIEGSDQKVAIECKVTQAGRAEVYRQVRRYVEEANVTALILFAPWFGIQSFVVDKTPVIVIDYTKNSI